MRRLSAWCSRSVNTTRVDWVMIRSSTAQHGDRQLPSPGNRPMILVRRRTSPSERSSGFVDRRLRRCLSGYFRRTGSAGRSSARHAAAEW